VFFRQLSGFTKHKLELLSNVKETKKSTFIFQVLTTNPTQYEPMYKTLSSIILIEWALIKQKWSPYMECFGYLQDLYPLVGQGVKKIDMHFAHYLLLISQKHSPCSFFALQIILFY